MILFTISFVFRGITLASSNLTLQGLEEKTSYLINIRPLLENEAGPWEANDFLVKTKGELVSCKFLFVCENWSKESQ